MHISEICKQCNEVKNVMKVVKEENKGRLCVCVCAKVHTT